MMEDKERNTTRGKRKSQELPQGAGVSSQVKPSQAREIAPKAGPAKVKAKATATGAPSARTKPDNGEPMEMEAAIPFDEKAELLERYGCGPIRFTGADGFFERHLLFDNVAPLGEAGTRERYEACARSVRDVLSQRWVRTQETY